MIIVVVDIIIILSLVFTPKVSSCVGHGESHDGEKEGLVCQSVTKGYISHISHSQTFSVKPLFDDIGTL